MIHPYYPERIARGQPVAFRGQRYRRRGEPFNSTASAGYLVTMTWCAASVVRLQRGARTYTLLATGIVLILRQIAIIPSQGSTWHFGKLLTCSVGTIDRNADVLRQEVECMRPGNLRVESFWRPNAKHQNMCSCLPRPFTIRCPVSRI